MTEINKTDDGVMRRFASAMQARVWLADLFKGQDTTRRWTDSEMRGCEVKIFPNPIIKGTLKQVAFSLNENMNEFLMKAMEERIARVLNERIAAQVADEEAYQAKKAADAKAEQAAA